MPRNGLTLSLSKGEAILALTVGLSVPVAAPAQTAGDAARGEVVFQKCFACHSVDPADVNLPGPNLAGVVGRRAGVQPGFRYSEAFPDRAARGLVWDATMLDRYLAAPEAVVPGTHMGSFVGLPNPQESADVIAYLAKSQTK